MTRTTDAFEAVDADADAGSIDPSALRPPPPAGDNGTTARADRSAELVADTGDLRTGASRVSLGERILMIIGGIIAPLGLLCILLAWVGASRTYNEFEQIPYLISGGLLGLALVFLGGFFYFSHWMTTLVKEHRQQSVDLIDAVRRMHDDTTALAARIGFGTDTGAGSGARPQPAPPAEPSVLGDFESPPRPRALVATARGSMAHRRSCAVVAGKDGLQPVDDPAGWAACKLCEPFAE